MNLYLVQHAEAKSEQEDPQRPLSDKGRTDIKKVAAFVAQRKIVQVKTIFHSGKTRAQQTAEALAQQLKPSQGVKQAEGLEPMADPSTWSARLADEKEDIVVVGHLPHLSRLASHLIYQEANRKIVDFQMGGIVCLGRDESGAWSVRWMVVPTMLGS
jgi:phosphohistidine phosphatase